MKMCVVYVNVRISRRLKEELAWVIDKRLRVISSAERNNQLFGLFVRNGDIRMFSSQ